MAIERYRDRIANHHCGIDLFTQDHYQLPH